MRDIPEPCTHEAYENGCICHIPMAGPTALEPPDPKINRLCPLHGNEPDGDYLFDKMRDDKLTGDR